MCNFCIDNANASLWLSLRHKVELPWLLSCLILLVILVESTNRSLSDPSEIQGEHCIVSSTVLFLQLDVDDRIENGTGTTEMNGDYFESQITLKYEAGKKLDQEKKESRKPNFLKNDDLRVVCKQI